MEVSRGKEGKFASNKKIGPETIVDLDEEGKDIGIELLSASKRVALEELKRVKVCTPA